MNKNQFNRNLTGPKDLIILMKEISLKLRISEFHVICEYSNNKFIPDSYDFIIKGIYDVNTHRKFDYPDGLTKKIYAVTKSITSDFKCYRFINKNPLFFKADDEATKLIRAVDINGKFGMFKTYFWDDTNEEDLKEIGDIDFN